MKSPPRLALGASSALDGPRASTPKTSSTQLLDASAEPIAKLRPWESPATLRLRGRLNKAALYAANRATNAQSPDARAAFWHVSQVAGAWTFATATDDELRDMLHGLNLQCCGADAFERNGSGC